MTYGAMPTVGRGSSGVGRGRRVLEGGEFLVAIGPDLDCRSAFKNSKNNIQSINQYVIYFPCPKAW
jgi:hypothetical protein